MRGWVIGGACVVGGIAAACGRIGFDSSASDVDADLTSPDAPPLPALICGRDLIPLDGVPDSVDLAGAGLGSSGLALAWAPTAGGRATGLILDASRHPIGPAIALTENTSAIGGIVDTGSTLVTAMVVSGMQSVVRFDRTFAQPQVVAGESSVLGRESFAAEQTGLTRAWLRGTTSGSNGALAMSYVRADGSVITGQPYLVAGTITAVAGDNGPDHAHAVWREDLPQNVQRCTACDIDFLQSDTPVMGSQQIITDDCVDVRNASGPVAADSMIIVWSTTAGGVLARYIASSGDVDTPLSAAGRAPKVRFDGTRFWVAWIDAATGDIVLAKLDLDGTIETAPLPGRVPAGDEAFELVRTNGTVYLAILAPHGLEILTPCQS